jgi:hypothetical protein
MASTAVVGSLIAFDRALIAISTMTRSAQIYRQQDCRGTPIRHGEPVFLLRGGGSLSSSCSESFEQVIEIQSQYARMAYEVYVAELSKLGTGPQSELGLFFL